MAEVMISSGPDNRKVTRRYRAFAAERKAASKASRPGH